MRRKTLNAETYIEGIKSQNRVILSQAITLVESRRPEDQATARKVLEGLMPLTGKALRLGITGVPGVGKSTFIEAFGKFITGMGKKLAVLAIDPSSQRSRGSIMGDKTRMETLSVDPLAYIRPSPTGNSLGGVARNTREIMLLCEAAGFEVIFIETVGVGQSETLVHGMVDFFLLLMLAGAGDELQGIKRGIMEMADSIVINKADGENKQKALMAKREYENALHLFPLAASGWSPPVTTCSAIHKQGLDDIWQSIMNYQSKMQANGFWESKRQQQNLDWLGEIVKDKLLEAFYQNQTIVEHWDKLALQVKSGELAPSTAASQLLEIYRQGG